MPLKHSPRARRPRSPSPSAALDALPYRGVTGARRPAELAGLALWPEPMPSLRGGRPLKAWRYVAFFSPELVCCAARVSIGPLHDAFWAVLDRRAGLFWSGRRGVALGDERAAVTTRRLRLQIAYTPAPGIECVARSGAQYAWTAKRAPLAATAGWRGEQLDGLVLVDDTAAYYERHTRWYWSAGVGHGERGQTLAWNLVSGVNDAPQDSERTIWVDGVAHEPPPSVFAPDLSAVDGLRFTPEATLRRRTDVGLVRSDYRLPMGTFTGQLDAIALRDGLGVMERHDAWW